MFCFRTDAELHVFGINRIDLSEPTLLYRLPFKHCKSYPFCAFVASDNTRFSFAESLPFEIFLSTYTCKEFAWVRSDCLSSVLLLVCFSWSGLLLTDMGLPDLASVTDEGELQQMLDNTSDFDERKAIRQRIREVKDVLRKEMDERLKKTETAREEMLKYRHAQADESKQRYLAMYNDAAKSGAAGGEKRWNTDAYKRAEALTSTPRPAGESVKLTPSSKSAPTAKSARDAFKAADAQNNPQTQGLSAPAAKPLSRSPTAIKDMLLNWSAKMTEGYPNVNVTNFSGSWANGLAFCALVHKFFPDAFDFNSLSPNNRKQNLELAFKKAEELADISPLLEVDDMLMMKDKPDWKCVFCYVQALYRGLHQLTPPS